MSEAHFMYRLEVTAFGDRPVRWFDTAEDALKAINCLRSAHVSSFELQDDKGATLSVGQLAAIVIERQLRNTQRNTKVV